MEELFLFLSGFILLVQIPINTNGFNLDTKVPIVKEGTANSYFGFSVAQHQIFDSSVGRSDHVLLIGAPLDNSTAPEIKDLNRPGVVYRCPFSSNTNDCVALALDTDPPGKKTIKDDQWLGVSVASQGTTEGMAVACAHRFTVGDDNYRRGLGTCFSITNTLDEDNYLDPCASLPQDKNHVDYGMCQAGTSVAIDTEDGDVLIGAPGSRTWRGSAFKFLIKTGLDTDDSWYRTPADPIDKNNPGPPPAVTSYSYLGTSTKIGYVIGNKKTFISGAPRSKDVGQVIMFLQEKDNLILKTEHYLTGEQFGSWFGCDLAIVDLDNDKLEDIVVGAPFYSELGVGGAIYVYMNGPNGITSATKPIKIKSMKMSAAKCKERNCENARFGFSVTRIGDVDRDGYDDIAVGAPFEKDGVVYIFRGGEKGMETTHSQRITADDLQSARPLKTFGYSLSAGNDMDNNGYPDLLVGSYDSNKAIVLRARPVINVQTFLISFPSQIDTTLTKCKKDGKPYNCFEIRACFSFNAEPKKEFTGLLPITYKLEAERFTGRVKSRVFFKGTSTEDVIVRDLDIAAQESRNNTTCDTTQVYIIQNNKDFLNPIPFRLTYSLKGIETPVMNPGEPVPPFNTYPVLNEKAAEQLLQVHFVNNCGSDKTCQSNLVVRATFPDLPIEDGNPVLKIEEGLNQNKELRLQVTVANNGEDAHESIMYISLPEYLSYIGTGRTDQKQQFSCTPLPGNILQCNIGNPLKSGERSIVIVRLDTKNLEPTTPVVMIGVNATTTSDEVDSTNNGVSINLRVVIEIDLSLDKNSKPSEVFYGGVVRGESAIKYEDEIGLQVVHTYVVTNQGHGKVGNITVVIDWPYEVQNKGYAQGKHLLYLMEEPMVDPLGTCVTPSYAINPLNIKSRQTPSIEAQPNATVANILDSNDRPKRETEVVASNLRDSSGQVIKGVVLDCDKGTAKCFKIMCSINQMSYEDTVLIQLRARFWNSTFLEDYKNVDTVYIYSKAEIIIDPALNIKEVSLENNVAKALTKAIPDIQVADRPGIPLWAIIVAAIAGLLLLILLIIILWKCGFFQRRRHPDDMKTHKGQLKKQNYDDEYYN